MHNQRIGEKETQKKNAYTLSKLSFLLAFAVLLFHFFYFREHTIETSNLNLYQATLIIPFFLIFLAFMFFMRALFGRGKSDDDLWEIDFSDDE
jgi:O-antigen/teichoic acid export membrane protein